MIKTAASAPFARVYHVFTWKEEGLDDFFSSFAQASKYYDKLCRKYGDVRLYEEVYNTEDTYEMGMPDDEICIRSQDEIV